MHIVRGLYRFIYVYIYNIYNTDVLYMYIYLYTELQKKLIEFVCMRILKIKKYI